MVRSKKISYIILSVLFLGLLVFSLLKVSDSFKSNSDGTITIRVIERGNVVAERNVEFNVGDNLEDLIINNFNDVVFVDGMLMNIEGITTPNDWSYFFWGTINGVDFPTGAKDIEFEDKDVIEFTFIKNTSNENS